MSLLRSLALFAAVAALAYGAFVALMHVKQRSLLFYPQFTRHPPAPPDFRFDVEGARCAAGW